LSREGPSEIPEVVRSLSECLRYALHPKKSGMATLRQELQQVNSYLHVERVRFGENLVVESDIPEAAQQAFVPEFLLQPLLENAIKYGMRTSEIPLRVHFRARGMGGMLEVEIRNTGHWFRNAGNTDGGVGLENLRNRLNLLFGDRFRLTTAEEAGWVSVTVTIPLKHDDHAGMTAAPL
jgi:LytS/YehU family sensor histidine kinase